jgi:hypothetical protein
MRKKCVTLITLLILFEKTVSAQVIKDSSHASGLKSFAKATVGMENGLEYEKRINKCTVLDVLAGIGIGYASDEISISKLFTTRLIVTPDLFVEYRNYYNLERRLLNSKKTVNNSANFLFAKIESFLPVKNQNYLNLLFIEGWGLQRSPMKRIGLTYWLGIIEHLYFDKPPRGGFNYVRLEPELTLLFSYIFQN